MLEKVESEHSTCLPLNLTTKSPKDPEISDMTVDEVSTSPSSMSSNSSHVPKMNLLQLAGAVTYMLENDPQSCDAFHSSSSSPSIT